MCCLWTIMDCIVSMLHAQLLTMIHMKIRVGPKIIAWSLFILFPWLTVQFNVSVTLESVTV